MFQTPTLAPPAGGWRRGGRLRVQARAPLRDGRWTATLNDVALEPAADVSEPYANPYSVGLGHAEEYRAWSVPAALLKTGENQIALTLEEGKATSVTYLDLAVS